MCDTHTHTHTHTHVWHVILQVSTISSFKTVMSAQTTPTDSVPADPAPADSPPLPPPHEASRRQYWGYLARIVFVVLVAVIFNKRDAIQSSVTHILGRKPQMDEDLHQTKPLNIPEHDHFNPIFDPENPPEPIFSKSGTRMITKNELAAHGHSGPLEPIWLAMTGKVFDVSKGAEHYYGPNGGYKFFSG